MWRVSLFLLIFFTACQATTSSLPIVEATAVSPSAIHLPANTSRSLPPTYTPLSPIIGATISPTPAPIAPINSTPSPIPDAYAGLTITDLANRRYGQGQLEIVETLATTTNFTRYLIRYPSDGLTIYGFMNVPPSQTPLPVVLLLHGYVDPAEYQIQAYTTPYADTLASAGFLVIHPNYRNHPPSTNGDNPFRIGYAIDALNLLALVQNQAGTSGPLQQADGNNIHLFGHSMGGGIALRVITVNQTVKTAVLYGAMSGNERLNYERIAQWARADATSWELVTADEDLQRISPIYHLHRIQTAVSIHHGTADTIVPPEWSNDLCQRLTNLNKNVDCFTYSGQGHNFVGNATQQLTNRAITLFQQQ